MGNEKHNNIIAIVKGLAIMLVVIGHTAYTDEYTHFGSFVYLFHVPLFFVVSGYCFKKKYLDDKSSFLLKRIKGLYLPFIKWQILFLLVHNTFFTLNIYSVTTDDVLYNWQDVFNNLQRIICFDTTEKLAGTLWFLPVLFFASLFSFIVIWIISCIKNQKRRPVSLNNKLLVGLILFFIALSIIRFKTRNFGLSFFSYQTLLASALFVTGCLIKLNKLRLSKIKKQSRFITVSLIFLILCLIAIIHPVNMSKLASWYDILIFYTTTVLGCILLFNFCHLINRTPLKSVFVYVGTHTLEILIWHCLMFKIISYAKIQYYGLDFKSLAQVPIITEHNNLVWVILYFIAGMSPLLFCYAREKLFQYSPNTI